MRRSWLTGVLTGVAAGLVVLAFARTIQAQGAAAPSGRVACVNVIRILNEYQKQKDLIEELSARQEKLQIENNERRAKIDTLDAEISALDRDDPTLVTRMRELLTMQVDYKNWGEMAQLDMAREFGLWSVRNYRDILNVVEEIARRDGYDLVFYKGELEAVSMDPEVIHEQIRRLQVLYASPAVEVTQVVLDKLNADYRTRPKRPMLEGP